jgi:hypothetical protein
MKLFVVAGVLIVVVGSLVLPQGWDAADFRL